MKGPETKLFGVALDPSDDPLSLEMKRAWMLRDADLASDAADAVDPYDSFLSRYPDLPAELGIQAAGKFSVPSWLWPRPWPSDLSRVTTRKIAEYYDRGHFERLLQRLQEFVEKRIFPARPLMLGIDHAASAAVVSALLQRYRKAELSAVVLDQHFDAIPASVRSGQSGLAAADHLCCGNFWSRLLEQGTILAQNLSILGVADYPGKNSTARFPEEFRRRYLEFEKAGVRFFPLSEFKGAYQERLAGFVGGALKTPRVYLSLDLDVASFKGVLAARYMDWPGLSARQLIQVACELRTTMRRQKVELAGSDIMEFNQHFLGLESEDGSRDKTLELVAHFLRIIFSQGREDPGAS